MEINDLQTLRCIVTLAEELHFGKAAARLHMSQPPLTRLVTETERIVGTRLFERTTRRVQLTAVGEVFVAEARAVLHRSEEAWNSVQQAMRQQENHLRIAYTPHAFATVLPGLLAVLRQREHDIRIDLTEVNSTAQSELLTAGRIDFAFRESPWQNAKETGESVLLHREPLRLLLPQSHPLNLHEVITPDLLAHETIILHPRHEYPGYYDRVLQTFAAAGISPAIYHREAQQNCLALVAAGNGLLLTTASHTPPTGTLLRTVPLSASLALTVEVWANWRGDTLRPHAQAFRAILQTQAISTH
jgi:LysR family transcriptional regulator, benzoate and cis,cis-muconate-responsive activator of ben and cat genes